MRLSAGVRLTNGDKGDGSTCDPAEIRAFAVFFHGLCHADPATEFTHTFPDGVTLSARYGDVDDVDLQLLPGWEES